MWSIPAQFVFPLQARTILTMMAHQGLLRFGLMFSLLLVACDMPAAQHTRFPPPPSPINIHAASTSMALPAVTPDPNDPFVGQWIAVVPSDDPPTRLVVTKDAAGNYHFDTSDGTSFSPIKEQEGSLYFHSDEALFSHPWQRYSYDAPNDQLQLITADDVKHPKRYRRSQ